MKDCSRCGYPMTWSDDRQVLWCSVYGTHEPMARRSARNALVHELARPVRRHLKAVS